MQQLTKKVNTFDKPEQKKQAAKEIKLAVGGVVKDSKRLAEQEKRIDKHLEIRKGCDFEIGRDLYEIQQEGNFPDKTFEAYIKRRWEHDRAWGYKLIDSYKVKEGLPQNVSPGIQNTKQALALKAAEPEVRADILKEVASEGEVTAKAITEKIEERKKEKPKSVEISEKDNAEDADFEEVKKHEVESSDISEYADDVTGEVLECQNCIRLAELLKEKERNHRGLVFKYNELARDKEEEMKRDKLYPEVVDVFDYWKTVTKHGRSHFTLDTYILVRPWVKKYGVEACKDAIDGAAFDCYKDERKNGSVRMHNDLDLIMRDRKHFEEFIKRSPKHGKKK